MGLNVGGIHLLAKDITQQEVAEHIVEHWLTLGAELVQEDALEVRPLSVEKKGDLAFCVFPVIEDNDGIPWIAVYDSERYTADVELAKTLAQRFETSVIHWAAYDASNSPATRRVYGPSCDALVEELPAAYVYFNQLKDQVPDEHMDEFIFVRFKVPYLKDQKYSGPSLAQRRENELVVRAKSLAARYDVDALRAISGQHAVYWQALKPAVESADLLDPVALKFVVEIGDVIADEGHNLVVAEAALRAGDDALFDRAMPRELKGYQAGLAHARAHALGSNGEPRLAYRILEAVTRSGAARPEAWNNLLYFAHAAGVAQRLSATLLDGARAAGEVNAPIFHNLACVHIVRGEPELALDAVERAARFGYDMTLIERDEDLAAIREHARFRAALASKATRGIEHMVVERGRSTLVRPAIGLHLFFNRGAPEAAAHLMSVLRDVEPEMFKFYRPSGVLGMEKTGRGKLTRDINQLKKNNAPWGYTVHYDEADGHACERRFLFEGGQRAGEIDVALPLAQKDDADGLFARLLDLVRELPFSWGNAGLTLVPYEVGNLVGPATDAHDEIARLSKGHAGVCLSPQQCGYIYQAGVSPSWLTFLSTKMSEKVSLAGLDVSELAHGVAIRASAEPLPAGEPSLLKALAPLLPKGSRGWERLEHERLSS